MVCNQRTKVKSFKWILVSQIAAFPEPMAIQLSRQPGEAWVQGWSNCNLLRGNSQAVNWDWAPFSPEKNKTVNFASCYDAQSLFCDLRQDPCPLPICDRWGPHPVFLWRLSSLWWSSSLNRWDLGACGKSQMTLGGHSPEVSSGREIMCRLPEIRPSHPPTPTP